MLTVAWPLALILLPLPFIFWRRQTVQAEGGRLQLPGISQTGKANITNHSHQSRKRYWLMWSLLVLAIADRKSVV